VAAETGTHVIDIRSAFLRESDYRDSLCADGIHPNGAGHVLIAARVGDWLERFCGRMLRADRADSSGSASGEPAIKSDKKDHAMV
jgi:hypothetical protein